jgi:ubiquinone/menaquinone biosynthesis C-methylase UbiE
MPLTHAKKICPQALLCIQHDSEKLPFEDDYFDFTYTVCVLHHVPVEKWEKFLSEMYRVTRKDGLVAVIEHNPINPLTQLIVRTCKLDKNAVLVGSRKMKQLMKKAGLSKVEINYILFTPWRGKFFRVFDESINWLPIGAQYIALGHKS